MPIKATAVAEPPTRTDPHLGPQRLVDPAELGDQPRLGDERAALEHVRVVVGVTGDHVDGLGGAERDHVGELFAPAGLVQQRRVHARLARCAHTTQEG